MYTEKLNKPTFETISAAIQNHPAAQNVDPDKCAALGAEGIKALIESKIDSIEWKTSAKTPSELQEHSNLESNIVQEVIASIS